MTVLADMALYRGGEIVDYKTTTHTKKRQRAARQSHRDKLRKLHKTSIFTWFTPNLIAMILLTIRQKVVVYLSRGFEDADQLVVQTTNLLVQQYQAKLPEQQDKDSFMELIQNHLTGGISDAEFKWFHKILKLIRQQKKISEQNQSIEERYYTFFFEDIEQEQDVDDTQPSNRTRSPIGSPRNSNLNWDDSDDDDEEGGGQYHSGEDY
jgi:hypothetical protein